MRRITQNIDTYTLIYNVGENRLFFPKDRLWNDKKIKRITFFSNGELQQDVLQLPTLPMNFFELSYLTLYDEDGKKVFNNLSLYNLLPGHNTNFNIGKKINFDLSEISIIAEAPYLTSTQYALICAIEWENDEVTSVDEPTNERLITIPLQTGKSFYLLSDYFTSSLKEFKIKRLIASVSTTSYVDYFLTLRDVNGKVFNQIPGAYLKQFLYTEDVLIDNYEIDFYNSYIEIPGNTSLANIKLQFYY